MPRDRRQASFASAKVRTPKPPSPVSVVSPISDDGNDLEIESTSKNSRKDFQSKKHQRNFGHLLEWHKQGLTVFDLERLRRDTPADDADAARHSLSSVNPACAGGLGKRRPKPKSKMDWKATIPSCRSKVLCLGMSYASIADQLTEVGVDRENVMLNPMVGVDQVVELVRRKVLTQMDGRDLARIHCIEESNEYAVYTVSLEGGSIYDKSRHMNANFNRGKFVSELLERWGNGRGKIGKNDRLGNRKRGLIQFREVYLDYFWIPPGSWAMTHWKRGFFDTALPNLAAMGVLEGEGIGTVYLPFCLQCFKEVVASRLVLFQQYVVSFLEKKDLREHSLWRATQKIDPNVMQFWLGKAINQEDKYCTFSSANLRVSAEDSHVSKDDLMRVYENIKNVDQVRMIKLRVLKNGEVGGFLGMDGFDGLESSDELFDEGRNGKKKQQRVRGGQGKTPDNCELVKPKMLIDRNILNPGKAQEEDVLESDHTKSRLLGTKRKMRKKSGMAEGSENKLSKLSGGKKKVAESLDKEQKKLKPTKKKRRKRDEKAEQELEITCEKKCAQVKVKKSKRLAEKKLRRLNEKKRKKENETQIKQENQIWKKLNLQVKKNIPCETDLQISKLYIENRKCEQKISHETELQISKIYTENRKCDKNKTCSGEYHLQISEINKMNRKNKCLNDFDANEQKMSTMIMRNEKDFYLQETGGGSFLNFASALQELQKCSTKHLKHTQSLLNNKIKASAKNKLTHDCHANVQEMSTTIVRNDKDYCLQEIEVDSNTDVLSSPQDLQKFSTTDLQLLQLLLKNKKNHYTIMKNAMLRAISTCSNFETNNVSDIDVEVTRESNHTTVCNVLFNWKRGDVPPLFQWFFKDNTDRQQKLKKHSMCIFETPHVYHFRPRIWEGRIHN
mmetsp:Transcript_21958/g.50043  ORF Transcript_21958/g.50043 Transcript_21958/m.50043 type:complete len:900 (-) Transcript_21958:56-2755(-)